METTPLKPDQSTGVAEGMPVVDVEASSMKAPVSVMSETAKFTYHTVPNFFPEKLIPVI